MPHPSRPPSGVEWDSFAKLRQRVDAIESRLAKMEQPRGKFYTEEEIDKIVDQIIQTNYARIRNNALEAAAQACDDAAEKSRLAGGENAIHAGVVAHYHATQRAQEDDALTIRALKSRATP